MTVELDPDFERVRAALRCQQPDRVPSMELLMDTELKAAFLGHEPQGYADEVDFWYRAGYDYICVRAGYELDAKGVGASGDKASPAGRQALRRVWAPEHKGQISSWADFERYPWPDPDDATYDHFDEIRNLLSPGMKMIGRAGDIFTNAWMYMGFESFCYAMVEQPDLVAALMDKIGRIILRTFERMAEIDGVGALWYCDDVAYTEGLLVSPHFLRERLFPWMRRIGDVCKAHDLPYVYHTDGVLWEVMDDLIECGINGLQPIEPKSMDIAQVKQRYGRRLCLIGNIDLGYTLTRGTPSEVEAEVRQRIRDCAPGGGYCVGSSNTVTHYVPVENFRAMIEATRKYGQYPIRLEGLNEL